MFHQKCFLVLGERRKALAIPRHNFLVWNISKAWARWVWPFQFYKIWKGEPKILPSPKHCANQHSNFKVATSLRVDRPIIDRLPTTEHFGRSFPILLHFEWFKMLQEHILKLYKSSLKCKVKKIRFFELQNAFLFFHISSFWLLLVSNFITFFIFLFILNDLKCCRSTT